MAEQEFELNSRSAIVFECEFKSEVYNGIRSVIAFEFELKGRRVIVMEFVVKLRSAIPFNSELKSKRPHAKRKFLFCYSTVYTCSTHMQMHSPGRFNNIQYSTYTSRTFQQQAGMAQQLAKSENRWHLY